MREMIKWFDCKIPYEPKRRLDLAYTRAVRESFAEWVLLLDHDVFLCNPFWYLICLKALNNLNDPKARLITCVTNGVHRANRTPQGVNIATVMNDDIGSHVKISKRLYKKNGDASVQINWKNITGFFMLVKRSILWEGIEFKRGETGKIDWNLGQQIIAGGYHIYLLPGLYVYHRRGLMKQEWSHLPIADYTVEEKR